MRELGEIRKDKNITQAELSKTIKMSQGDISRFERREDHRLSSLARYCEGLGFKMSLHLEPIIELVEKGKPITVRVGRRK